ncbi:cytochrome P450 [Streptomyces ruber]|uniref:Cytochrome P450 n=2 Tax=Streptomyces TaxID=1883 RepID=A0A918EQ34_9ACTN|nr:cytochrome P450 [Streptomyces ruber]GGQ46738.1 cytochrome P450 [Streptomyces ruber]
MTSGAPRVDAEPFGCPVMAMRRKPEVHDTFREAGPVVEVRAPAGGPAWVVTDDAVAREVLTDPRFVKDPELAPASWRGVDDGLDRPVPELRPYTLIAVDGEDHRRLRRIHAPAFNPRRLAERADRIAVIAGRLLTELADVSDRSGEPAELVGGFAYHFPLLVICELLGVPVTDPVMAREAVSVLKALGLGGPQSDGGGGTGADGEVPDTSALEGLLSEAVRSARRSDTQTMTRVLYERATAEFGSVTDDQLIYMITGLIFAGHDTTGSFLGFLLAEFLAGHLAPDADDDAVSRFVEEALRHHPPVPYTLWRFAATEVTIGGVRLPRGAPVLVDIEGINTDARHHDDPHGFHPDRPSYRRLTFGDGPHYCIGEQLAQLESRTMIGVLRNRFPAARLAVPYDELRWSRQGAQTARLTGLPAWLR